jgi:YVTN family beta-propeller protein
LLLMLAAAGCDRASRAPVSGDFIYITNEDSGDLSVIDAQSHRVVRTIPLGKRPRGAAISPDGETLYVALSGSPRAGPGVDEATLPAPDRAADGIGVVSLTRQELLRVLPSGTDPEQVAVSHDGTLLFVANEDAARATVVDVNSGTIVESFAVGGEPEGIAVQPLANRVWVTSEEDGHVYVIDWLAHRVVGRIHAGARPRSVAFTPDGLRAYVPCENSGTVAVIDATTLQLLTTIPLDGARAMGAVVAAGSPRLYVTTGRTRRLVTIDTDTHDVLNATDVGERPWGVAADSARGLVYTANGPANDVSVVDINRQAIVARIPVGANPWGAIFGRIRPQTLAVQR